MTPERKQWWESLPPQQQEVRKLIKAEKQRIKTNKKYIGFIRNWRRDFRAERELKWAKIFLAAYKSQLTCRPYLEPNRLDHFRGWCRCGRVVRLNIDKYCSKCGVRLDWSEQNGRKT